MEHVQCELVTAAGLEDRGILPKVTAYKMARAGLLIAYRVGIKGRGIRFNIEEVLSSLRQPAKVEAQTS